MVSEAYRRGYDLIDWSDLKPARPKKHGTPKARADFAVPNIIREWSEPVEHPVTGEMFTSPTEFSRRTRELGYTEYGDDPQRFKQPERKKASRQEIRDAIHKAEALVAQGFDPSKHTLSEGDL